VAHPFQRIDETSDGEERARRRRSRFYTVLLDQSDDREKLLEAFEKRGAIETLLADIAFCDPGDARELATLIALKERIEGHLEAEEKEIFAVAKSGLFGDEARARADEMRERRPRKRT
jgi:hypothetical protein